MPTPPAQLFADVVGQDRAVAALRAAARRPVHAYLLVGPEGTGKAAAAVSFAAALLCPTAGDHTAAAGDHTAALPAPAGVCDTCRRVLAGLHPDAVTVEREGASIGIAAAREVVRNAYMSPVEGGRKVIVLHDFHLVRDTGPALLKTIEEPPPGTVFVILAEYLPPELVTIASRCVRVDFDALSAEKVLEALVASGVERERAQLMAEASGGRLARARLLTTDPQFEARRRAWHEAPTRLDGSGAAAAAVADELIGLLDASLAPLEERQAAEVEGLRERNRRNAEVVGTKKARATKAVQNAGLSELEERHRREQRRQRTDEMRTGLATLAGAYRERLAQAADGRRRNEAVEAISRIDQAARSLTYNPGEVLLLQALFARLGRLAAR